MEGKAEGGLFRGSEVFPGALIGEDWKQKSSRDARARDECLLMSASFLVLLSLLSTLNPFLTTLKCPWNLLDGEIRGTVTRQ